MKRKATRRRGSGRRKRPAGPGGRAAGLAFLIVALLLLAVPFLVVPTARDPFRLPKLMGAEVLALASLLPLAWRFDGPRRLAPASLLRQPVIVGLAPLLALATAGLAFTAHPELVRQGLIDLWIGAAALVGWSLALPAERSRRLLDLLALPAAALSLLAILQFHDLWEPLRFAGGEEAGRLGVAALAGNPGDLGAWLVLPLLVAQLALWQGRRRWLWGSALALMLYALVASQTLTALAAVALASGVLWFLLLPRRRAVVLLAAGATAALVLALAVAPLRERLVDKGGQLARGEINRLLTGRLDGWRTAFWMTGRNPLTGVGHGAYQAEFVPAKLALLEDGVPFYRGHAQPTFANAHNEYLEVAAELGLPGLLALGWLLWLLWRTARRADGALARGGDEGAVAPGGERALIWSGLAGLAVVSLTYFPFRVALVAFPALLFLAWLLALAGPEEGPLFARSPAAGSEEEQ